MSIIYISSFIYAFKGKKYIPNATDRTLNKLVQLYESKLTFANY